MSHTIQWVPTTGTPLRVTEDSGSVHDILSLEDNDLTIPAETTGNMSRYVLSTATSTAGYYSKLITFAFPATNNVSANLTILLTPKSASGSYAPIKATVTVLQATAGLSASSKIQVLESDETAIAHNGLFLDTATASNGTVIDLWMQSIIVAAYDIQLLSSSFDTGVSVSTYYDGATWQVGAPSGTLTITSDWSGSGLITSTSTTNSTGTVKYEKLSNGLCSVNFEFTALAVTTAGTTYFTMPAGFRHGISGFSIEERLSGTVAGGSAGRLVMSSIGVVAINSYTASTGTWRASFTYVARA